MEKPPVKQSVTRSARSTAYRLVSVQALVVILVAIGFVVGSGVVGAYSALLGGAACVLPSLYFAHKLFKTTSARDVKKIAIAFFVGEFVKLLLSGILVVIILILIPVKTVPFIITFVGAQFGFWLAPLLVKLET